MKTRDHTTAPGFETPLKVPPPSGIEIRRNRLLHLHMLFCFGADFNRLQPEIGKGADIDVVDLRVTADFFVRLDELGAGRISKFLTARFVNVSADGYFISDVFVGLRVLPRNRARANDSDSQVIVSPVRCSNRDRKGADPACPLGETQV